MASKKDERSVVPFPGNKYADKKGIAFGSTIKDYRIRAQMDQEQVGRACGLTGNTVSNWERGVSRPDLKLMDSGRRSARLRKASACDQPPPLPTIWIE